MNALPLLWLSLSFLAGLLAANLFFLPFGWIYLFLAFGIVLLFLEYRFANISLVFRERKQFTPLPWGIILVSLMMGFLRFQTTQIPITSHDIGWYNDSGKVILVGKVITPTARGERFIQVQLEVEQLTTSEGASITPISGTALLWVPKDAGYGYGDRLQVNGKLITPFTDNEFSYKDYLASKGIHSLMVFPRTILIENGAGNPLLTVIYAVRDWAYQTLGRLFPMPESSVFAGILLGIQSGIPDFLYKAYQATGTSHVLVISGFNISIIAALFSRLFKRILPYGWDALVTVIAISAYTLLVGAQPPVVRAAVMGCLTLPAYLLGRRLIGLNTLTSTAALMLFFTPSLLQDISFQLSFLATLGILCFAEPLQDTLLSLAKRLSKKENPDDWFDWISEYLLVTLTAQFAVLPAILAHFKYLSAVSLLANFIILPVQPAVMILGGITLLAGMVYFPVGRAIAYLAWLPALYSDRLAVWLGGLPFAMVTTSPFWARLAGIIFLLALIPAVRYQFSSQNHKKWI